jgi:hypothetical protein
MAKHPQSLANPSRERVNTLVRTDGRVVLRDG